MTNQEQWAFEKLWKIFNEKQGAEQIITTIDRKADELRYRIEYADKPEPVKKVSDSTPWNDIPGMYRHILEETAKQHSKQLHNIKKQ